MPSRFQRTGAASFKGGRSVGVPDQAEKAEWVGLDRSGWSFVKSHLNAYVGV